MDDPMSRVAAGLLLGMVGLQGSCDLSDMDSVCDQLVRELSMLCVVEPATYRGRSMERLRELAAQTLYDLLRRGMLRVEWGGKGNPFLVVRAKEGTLAAAAQMSGEVPIPNPSV